MLSAMITLNALLAAGAAPPVDARPPITIRATGVGRPSQGMRPPRSYLMARRAAEVVAVRNLARQITPVGGATVPPFRYVSVVRRADGSVEVTVEAISRRSP